MIAATTIPPAIKSANAAVRNRFIQQMFDRQSQNGLRFPLELGGRILLRAALMARPVQ